jgi:hypothetical protein
MLLREISLSITAGQAGPLFLPLSNGDSIMFKLNQKVRRNPKIWRNDTVTFTVVGIEGSRFICQRPGKTKCPFTGKLEPHQPMSYTKAELIAA